MSNSLPAHLFLCLRVFAAHYRQAPLQAGAILLGIVLAVTLLTGVRAVNENAKNSYNVTSEQFNQLALWQIVPKTGTKYLPEQIYFQVRKLGHNRSLAVLEGRVLSESGQRWSLQGSDLTAGLTAINTSQNSEQDSSLFSQPLPLAEMLAGEPYVLMAESQSDRLATNGSLTISNQRLNVVSLNDDFPLGSRLLTDISLAQKLLSAEGKISYVALFDELTPAQIEQLKQLSPDIRLVQSDKGENLSDLTDSFHLNLTAMSLLAFIVGLFISYNGVRYSLLKRQRLFTQLRQIGMLKLPLLLALCIELSVLVAAGSVAGFTFGLQLSHWLHPMVSTTLEQLYDANILATGWRWSWLLQSIALTLAASILACSSLFYQLLRQPLARSLGQFQIQQNAAAVHKVQFVTALVLLLVAGVLFPLTHNYKVTMVLLGLVVIAIPLFLPVALSFLVCQLQKLPFGGLRGYLIAETRELLPPLSAMMAILLAVTANVSMNTLVSSFEITLKQWLDARLHADLYIRPAQSEMVQVEQFLHQQPEITSVYKQYFVKKYATEPAYLSGNKRQ
ncbi:ABC transporter permease [Vibrio sp. SCSIO 43137]|uniref:ABC transporter permease n=1 Tax=Vibrio sp. SCSIO 43137 TaxID=3021011 RepID=UPI00230758EA|nr:ABC transporter permease [Vibrio sp. SCSIO 43137]WCE31776.1 ABC transporter permease [Vibrio sp. SCSIO 43137]